MVLFPSCYVVHCEPKKGGGTFVITTLEKHARFLRTHPSQSGCVVTVMARPPTGTNPPPVFCTRESIHKDRRRWWSFIARCSGDHYVLAIELIDGRTSRSHVGACYKVACYKVLLCDFVALLCSMPMCGQAYYKVACGFVACDFVASSFITRAAFYQISTDSVLAQSISGSWTSCLASFRPFIEILQSLVTA